MEIRVRVELLSVHEPARPSSHQARHKRQEKLRHSVFDFPALDRLMRYEAHLDRAFDRALGQLERLQRMQLGHPVPPPVKVEVSGT